MTTFERNSEFLYEESIDRNVEILNKFLKRELLEKTLLGTEFEEIDGRKYQAVIISGVIDNETGQIASLGKEIINQIEEYKRTEFSLRIIAAPVYKNKEEIIKDLNSNINLPPEIIDFNIQKYANPQLSEVLDRTIRKYVIDNA